MNFKLNDKEELLVTLKDILVDANQNEYTLTLFITTNRLVLLKDINNDILANTFLKSRVVNIPADWEVVLDINKKDISAISYQKGINVITFKNNNNELKIYTSDLREFF